MEGRAKVAMKGAEGKGGTYMRDSREIGASKGWVNFMVKLCVWRSALA